MKSFKNVKPLKREIFGINCSYVSKRNKKKFKKIKKELRLKIKLFGRGRNCLPNKIGTLYTYK